MTPTYATRFTHVKQLDGVVVVRPHGNLTGGEETDEIERLVDQLDAERVPCLIFNLSDVGMMSTLGISRLIAAHVKFTKRNARIGLCNVDKRIQSIFVITKLTMVFGSYPDEEAAIAGCKGESK